jgi:hypothetical protein
MPSYSNYQHRVGLVAETNTVLFTNLPQLYASWFKKMTTLFVVLWQ